MTMPQGTGPQFLRAAAPVQLPSSMLEPGGTLPMQMVVTAIGRLRDAYYPWMKILQKADGTVVVTISPAPEAGDR